MGMKQRKSAEGIAIDARLASKIPYLRCYDEEGIIETSEGRFTKMYAIGDIDPAEIAKTTTASARQAIQVMMGSFPANVSFQFVTHNRLIEQQKYLKQILVVPDKEPELNDHIANYNAVVADNASIGHNNIRKSVYFIVSVHTSFIDDAVETFRELDGQIQAHFRALYNIEVKGLSLVARLRVMYGMLNPGRGDFGKILDLDGSGDINLKNMKYLHITTKDLVAPKSLNSSPSLKNHIIINEDTDEPIYVRVFGITSIPSEVSDNAIADLTNVSSNMVFSTIYEPIDTQLGYETSKELVVKNTITRDVLKRDSVADRRARTKVRQTEQIGHTERDYFNNSALDLFQRNAAATQKTFQTTFVLAIFGASLDDINRDSGLLRISADKFGFKIKALDLAQLQGLQTVLPLCSPKVDLRRVLDVDRLVTMCPVTIQDIIRRGGAYNGLNAINDNLVLINRKNNRNLSGLISGVEHCGKTYQAKKEAFNALITTNDAVSIITDGDEYDDFAKQLGGEVVEEMHTDALYAVRGYGLQDREGNKESDLVLKSYFLDAFFVSLLHLRNSHAFDLSGQAYADHDRPEIKAVETEVAELIRHIDARQTDLSIPGANHAGVFFDYVRENANKYPTLAECIKRIGGGYASADAMAYTPAKRLVVYKVKDKTDQLSVMDYLRNKSVSDLIGSRDGSRKSPYNWIFIDPVDALLEDSAAADYLSEYMYKASMIKTVLTVVVQDGARLLGSPTTQLAFEDLIRGCGYFKLLNQGPIERHKYIDLLQIPQALVPYISNVEPGKGIIITSSSNAAFDDSFLPEDNPYHRLFAKEVEQIVIDGAYEKEGVSFEG